MVQWCNARGRITEQTQIATTINLSLGAAAVLLQFTFLLDDIGVPLNYRHMEGFGVHTFKLVAACGKETLVKFHWKPKCGKQMKAAFVVASQSLGMCFF